MSGPDERRSALLPLLPAGDEPASQQRVLQRLQSPPSPRRWPWLVPLPMAAAAAAAVLLWPTAPLDQSFQGDAWQTLTLSDHVVVDVRGQGAVSGTVEDTRVRLESGTVRAEIEPGVGVQFTVDTALGSARALGTAYTVQVDDVALRVEVERGRVGVVCPDGDETLLGPGESAQCMAPHPGALLAQARKQDAQTALATLDQAQALDPTPALAQELIAYRAEVLSQLGRHAEAQAQAREYLQTGGPRDAAMQRLLDTP